MISIKSLRKTFVAKSSQGFFKPKLINETVVIKDISFEVKEGEFVALLGPNGAGKTTTLKMLSGILYPTSGELDVFGYKPFEKKDGFKRIISFVMAQKSQLFMDLEVQDTFDFIAEIYQVDKEKYAEKLKELIQVFGIEDLVNKTARKLSLGQRMKCELICALIYEPKVIFLDEPTIGLDVNSAQEFRDFLKKLNQETKVTIILTTHNMDDVEALCERTIVINHGEIAFDGLTRDLKKIFGDKREIEFIVEENLDLTEDLQSELKIIQNDNRSLRIECATSNSTKVISEIMKTFNVLEINFKETDLHEVMGKLYKE